MGQPRRPMRSWLHLIFSVEEISTRPPHCNSSIKTALRMRLTTLVAANQESGLQAYFPVGGQFTFFTPNMRRCMHGARWERRTTTRCKSP